MTGQLHRSYRINRNQIRDFDRIRACVIAQRQGIERGTEVKNRHGCDLIHSCHPIACDVTKNGEPSVLRVEVRWWPTIVRQINEPLTGGAVWVPVDLCHRDSA